MSLEKMRDKPTMLYIMAPSYTGSTLLTFMLAAHRDISSIGELKATSMGNIDEYTCSCGELIKKCCFWKAVQEEMNDLDREFSLENFGTHFYSDNLIHQKLLRATVKSKIFEKARELAISSLPECHRTYKKIIKQNTSFAEAVCKIQKGKVFLDGSKDPHRLLHLLKSEKLNLKTIYLIRDGRGASYSYMKHYGVPMDVAAKAWKKKQIECDRTAEYFNRNNLIIINYEEMCNQPQKTINDICIKFGIEPFNDVIDFGASEQHILGNAMRLNNSSEIRLDEKWRKELNAEELNTFNEIAGSINRQYGYK